MTAKHLVVGASALAILCACGKSESKAADAATADAAAAVDASATAKASPEVKVAATSTPAASAPADAKSGAVAPVSAEERAAMIAALQLREAPGGMVMNECEEPVEPGIYPTDLGGAVGRALLFVMGGGPNTASCYGMTGMQFHLFRKNGAAWERIFSDFGSFAPMETRHDGVRDFAVGGPGFEFPTYQWNGKAFVAGPTIPDTEFPASLN